MADVKTFRAPSMPAALALVKRELGPDAVILGTRTSASRGLGGVLGRTQVEITAASPSAVQTPPRRRAALGLIASPTAPATVPPPSATRPAAPVGVATARPNSTPVAPVARGVAQLRRWEPPNVDAGPVGPASLPAAAGTEARPTSTAARSTGTEARAAAAPLTGALEPCYVTLVQNAVGAELARRLVSEAAQGAGGKPATAEALTATVRDFIARHVPAAGGVQLVPGTPRRVALIGPAGAGKTTTLAKLAAHFKLRKRVRVAILSLDMHRLGTDVQLQRYGEIVGVPVYAAQTISEVKHAVAECGAVDLLLIDTPGVGGREAARFTRLAALLHAAKPDETHLVMPAYMPDEVARRFAVMFTPLGFSRVVLTHLDDAVGFGVVLNTLDNLHCTLSYVSGGQRVPNDLEEACGARLAELICPTGAVHI